MIRLHIFAGELTGQITEDHDCVLLTSENGTWVDAPCKTNILKLICSFAKKGFKKGKVDEIKTYTIIEI